MNAMKALAKELLREVQTVDDYAAAKALLLDKITTDPQWQQVAIEYAVETYLANEWRAGRSARWRYIGTDPTAEPRVEPAFGGGARPAPEAIPSPVRTKVSFAVRRQFAEAVLRAKETLLMDYELGPGTRMKDSTRGDLLRFAGINESQAAPMLERAKWYRRVAALLPDDRTRVGAVLREADLRREEKKAKDGTATH